MLIERFIFQTPAYMLGGVPLLVLIVTFLIVAIATNVPFRIWFITSIVVSLFFILIIISLFAWQYAAKHSGLWLVNELYNKSITENEIDEIRPADPVVAATDHSGRRCQAGEDNYQL